MQLEESIMVLDNKQKINNLNVELNFIIKRFSVNYKYVESIKYQPIAKKARNTIAINPAQIPTIE